MCFTNHANALFHQPFLLECGRHLWVVPKCTRCRMAEINAANTYAASTARSTEAGSRDGWLAASGGQQRHHHLCLLVSIHTCTPIYTGKISSDEWGWEMLKLKCLVESARGNAKSKFMSIASFKVKFKSRTLLKNIILLLMKV